MTAKTGQTKTHQVTTLAKALIAALFRLGVGTAVFEPGELLGTYDRTVRCRNQLDGSIAIIVETRQANNRKATVPTPKGKKQ